MQCPELRELESWVQHSLPPERMSELEEHVASCDQCGNEVVCVRAKASGPHTGNSTIGGISPSHLALETAKKEIKPGTAIGRFVVVSELGEGGMGSVYLAYDPRLDRSVAVKILHGQKKPQESNAARVRLEREAQALARVSHPNTVAVYDVGASGDGIFIAMEHLEGKNLREWLKAGPRSEKEIIRVFKEAAQGLVAVHAAGLVHRDFKPSNVIITKTGQVKVLDFGLARLDSKQGAGGEIDGSRSASGASLLSEDSSSLHTPLEAPLTQAGSVSGTPGFMAPELFRETPASPASDQFAFGVSLYWALFDERPFQGTNVVSYWQSLLEGPARIPSGAKVATWLANIALKCLAHRPEERFPSMEAVIQALDSDPSKRRRQVGLWSLATLALAGAVGVGIWLSKKDPCPTGEQLKGTIWSRTPQAAIRKRLVSARPGFAPRIDGTLTRIQEVSEKWATQASQSCEIVRRANPTALEIQREACLQRQQQALTILVNAVAQADPSVVPSIDAVVEGFLKGLGCESDAAVMRVRADDVPPAQKELASKLRARMFRAQVAANLKDLDEATTEVNEVVASAQQAGLQGFESEAKVIRGSLEAAKGNPEAAMASYQDAFSLGIQAGTDERAFYAGSALIRQIREFKERVGEAKQVMVMVEALFVRLGKDPYLEMELLSTRAAISDAEGKLDDAIKFERQKLEIAKAVAGPRSRTTADAMEALSARLWKNGNIVESNEMQARKFEFYFELFGPDDPAVVYMYPVLTQGILAEGRTAAALESLETAIVQGDKVLSAGDDTVPRLKYVLALAVEGTDDRRVLTLADEVIAFYEKKTSQADLANALSVKARALARLGKPKEALPLCERAAQLRSELIDVGASNTRDNLVCEATVWEHLDNPRAAQLWRQALELKPPALPGEEGHMAFSLARVLWRIGRQKNEVTRYAEQAKKAYSAFPDFQDKVDQINQWLKSPR